MTTDPAPVAAPALDVRAALATRIVGREEFARLAAAHRATFTKARAAGLGVRLAERQALAETLARAGLRVDARDLDAWDS